MSMHDIIRAKRIALGLTQEQAAQRLGVTASAVNKWERGVSCPDITLLPALARLLDTDPNTLLCFQEDMSAEDLAHFLHTLTETAEDKGFAAAMAQAEAMTRRYPTCGPALLNIALTLTGLMNMTVARDVPQDAQERIDRMYRQAAATDDPAAADQAKTILASQAIARGDADQAEALIEELPQNGQMDRLFLRASLHQARGRTEEAAALLEGALIQQAGHIQTMLYHLTDLACLQDRLEDASLLAEAARALTLSLDLCPYGAYVADLQLAVHRRDIDAALSALENLLKALKEPWRPGASPLYRHIGGASSSGFGQRLLPKLLSELESPDCHDYDFLRETPAFQALLRRYGG